MMVETIALLSCCMLTFLDFHALIGKKCSPVYFTQYSMTSSLRQKHTAQYEAFVVSRCPIHDCKLQFLLASGQCSKWQVARASPLAGQACLAYLLTWHVPSPPKHQSLYTIVFIVRCTTSQMENIEDVDKQCKSHITMAKVT